jgi:hypothetical protein
MFKARSRFTSPSNRESRVILDEQHRRGNMLRGQATVVASLGMVAFLAIATVTMAANQSPEDAQPAEKAFANTPPPSNDNELRFGPTLRGEGEHREMLFRGHVFEADGTAATEFELVAILNKNDLGRAVIPVRTDGNEFEIAIPIGGSYWRYFEMTATTKDGRRRASKGISNCQMRQAATEDIQLRLAPTDRTVKVSVIHRGAPVANARVNAELQGNQLLRSQTNSEGFAFFRLCDGDKLSQVTAWTGDFLIGGHSFHRKPHWDPLANEFTIELDDCHDQRIRFLDSENNATVPNVPFELVIGTGPPNYNFAAVPATFPHCRMTTDKNGEATFYWFPNWKSHGAYVEIRDQKWAAAMSNNELRVADDGTLEMTLRRRVTRKPLVGNVSSDRFAVGGLLVEIKSFQGEEENRSDHVYAFTDKEGNFRADCITGATYVVCVNDGRLASRMIDLIPYEPDTDKSNFAELEVSDTSLAEIRVTSGPRRRPMANQWVYVRQNHSYTWLENGEKRSGTGARDYPVYTNSEGVAQVRAPAGTELSITVYAGEWRSVDRKLIVTADEIASIEIHREFDAEREVKGRLIAPPGMDVELAGAEIIYGSIDGETDEHETTTADAQGNFALKTKAIRIGIFAYTADGKASGVLKLEHADGSKEILLKPTMDFHGRLLDANNQPAANHAVRVVPRVSGKNDQNRSLPTSFETRTFETRTDADGNYTLKNLPTDCEATLRVDSTDRTKFDTYLDDVHLVVGDEQPRMISRLRGPKVK